MIKTKVKDIFQQSFKLDEQMDIESLEYETIKQWDSVGHMTLINALESSFNIMLDTDDIIDMSSFNKAVQIVEKHLS